MPEAWEELTPDQYLMYLTVLATRIGYPEAVQFVGSNQYFSFLIGHMGADFRSIVKEEHLPELEEAFEATRRAFPMNRVPDCGGLNLMPEWHGHKGPGDMLDGMTWGEFTKCSVIMSMLEDTEEELAKDLARTMYRIPEDEPTPMTLRLHCIGLLSGVMRKIQTEPINIDGQDIDFGILFKTDKRKRQPQDKTGWNGVTFEVAESGVFGSFREVNETGMWEVLSYLYKCRIKERSRVEG